MNGKEFANHIGVPHGTVKRWLYEGMPAERLISRKAVEIDPAPALAWIETRYPRSIAIGRVSHVYIATRGTDGAIKIGFTSHLFRRLSELRKEYQTDISLLAAFPGGKPDELALHARFAADRIDPDEEWFRDSRALRAFVASLGKVAA